MAVTTTYTERNKCKYCLPIFADFFRLCNSGLHNADMTRQPWMVRR